MKHTITLDASNLIDCINEISEKINSGGLSPEFIQRLLKLVEGPFDFFKLAQELTAVDGSGSPTSASHGLIRLYPSDRLTELLSALATGDINGLFV
jgi:hypothetical protein